MNIDNEAAPTPARKLSKAELRRIAADERKTATDNKRKARLAKKMRIKRANYTPAKTEKYNEGRKLAARYQGAIETSDERITRLENKRKYNKVYIMTNKRKASIARASVEGRMSKSETDIRCHLRRVFPHENIQHIINEFLGNSPRKYDWIFVGATIEVKSGVYHDADVTRSCYKDKKGEFVCDIKYKWSNTSDNATQINVNVCREKKYHSTLRSRKVIRPVYVKPRHINRI